MSYKLFKKAVLDRIDFMNLDTLEVDKILQEEAHKVWKGNTISGHDKRRKNKARLRKELRSMISEVKKMSNDKMRISLTVGEINSMTKRAFKKGAINELKIVIKRNSNFKYSRLDMIEFCEKRLNKLQGGETK